VQKKSVTTMDPDNPALNADGSLKNAEDMEREYSPTQPSRILPFPEPSDTIVNAAKLKPMAPIFQFGTQLGPEHFSTPKPLKWKHAGVASIVESARSSKGPEMRKEKTRTMTVSKVAAPKGTKVVNGAIQIVKGKYKKERRNYQTQIDAKCAAETQRWHDDSVSEIRKQRLEVEKWSILIL
jgi:hypothetical protein